jgi:uracil phosphoribosyltransferase
MIKDLSKENSILNQYIAELRDVSIQNDSMRFRRNLERVGEFIAIEISRTMEYEPREVITPLGKAISPVLVDNPVIASVLRAGIPLHNGVLNVFDRADNAFVSAYRKVGKDLKFVIKVEYVSSPDLNGRILIMVDPMLATGASAVSAYKELLNFGKPAHTHFVSAVSSAEGVEYFKRNMPIKDTTLWLAAIDAELTAKSYIVPGLGDAGDLAYGKKA